MYKRSGRGRIPQARRQPESEAIIPPLIPIQEGVQPSTSAQVVPQPLIPLQLPSPRAKLQHELSHHTATLPSQSSAAVPPLATKIPRRRLQKRQEILTTTITDANVVVVNGNGNAITTVSIIDVPTGSIAITLPFTTITVEPLQSITGTLSVSAGVGATHVPGVDPLPSSAPINSATIPAPVTSAQIPSAQATQGTPLPSSAVLPPSTTGNNQLGSSSTASPTSTTSSVTTSSSSNTPTLLTTTATPTPSTTSSFPISNGLASFSSSSSTTYSTSSSSSSSTSTSSSSSSSSSIGGAISSSAPSLTSSVSAPTVTPSAVTSVGPGVSVNAAVVGGVVGGLAGLALLFGLLLFLMRWWRNRRSRSMMLRSIDDETVAPGTSHSNQPMAQNPTAGAPLAGAAIGGAAAGTGIGAMIKRMTGGSTATSETSPSEKGFQNFGGRKLESVLISGGDGYGEPSGPGYQTPSSFSRGWAERFPYDTPSQHSSMIVGPATPYRRPSSSIAELSSSRPDSDTLKMMPSSPRPPGTSPAWPLTNTSAGRPVARSVASETSDTMLPLQVPRSIDPLGRSRSSQDGSRNSRFTEGL